MLMRSLKCMKGNLQGVMRVVTAGNSHYLEGWDCKVSKSEAKRKAEWVELRPCPPRWARWIVVLELLGKGLWALVCEVWWNKLLQRKSAVCQDEQWRLAWSWRERKPQTPSNRHLPCAFLLVLLGDWAYQEAAGKAGERGLRPTSQSLGRDQQLDDSPRTPSLAPFYTPLSSASSTAYLNGVSRSLEQVPPSWIPLFSPLAFSLYICTLMISTLCLQPWPPTGWEPSSHSFRLVST